MKIVSGRSETEFVPNENLTRAELTKIALNTFGYLPIENLTEKPFKDVELNAWYAPYVAKAKEVGIIDGYADGTFQPDKAVNRAEGLKILIGASNLAVISYPIKFEDVNQNDWYVSYVTYANEKGIVSGYETEGQKTYFKPGQFITRAEIAKIAIKTFDLKSSLQDEENNLEKKENNSIDLINTIKGWIYRFTEFIS